LKPDQIEQRIDAALGRLQTWEPPADFAARLAAAAAREAALPVVSPALMRAGNLLQRLSDSVLVVLAALCVAGLLAWVVPWIALIQSPNLISWACGITLGLTGLWLTQRTLLSR
jgi:hypothetical protein